MPTPLPKELRDRFARLIGEGLAGREAARRLQISAATGGRWARQIRRTGAVKVAPMDRPAGTGKLAAHVDFFRELVTQDPDITLFELRDALADAEGVTVHHSAIAGLLKRLGFTHKKSRWWLPSGGAQR
ncbi:transposase [Rhodobacteraceae bacterium MBR-64]|jgi:transposase